MGQVFDFRTVIMIAVVFATGFFGMRWISAGAPIPVVRVAELKPDPRIPDFRDSARKHIAEAREQEWLESKTAQSDGDPERDKLRNAVVEAATAFTLSACNAEAQRRYLEAAAAYARAYISLAGCPDFPVCRPDDAKQDKAKLAFGSPADGRAKQAIRTVHDMGISLKDYPGGIGPVVAHLSDSGYSAFGDGTVCERSRTRSATRAPLPSFGEARPQASAPPVPPRKERSNLDDPNFYDKINAESRERVRTSVLAQLRRPGPGLCVDPDHQGLVGAVTHYYYVRMSQRESRGIHDAAAKAAIDQAWSTAIDQQIDGLVRDFFVQGYFSREEVETGGDDLTKILAGATQTGRACSRRG
jgi:hypothetical protein